MIIQPVWFEMPLLHSTTFRVGLLYVHFEPLSTALMISQEWENVCKQKGWKDTALHLVSQNGMFQPLLPSFSCAITFSYSYNTGVLAGHPEFRKRKWWPLRHHCHPVILVCLHVSAEQQYSHDQVIYYFLFSLLDFYRLKHRLVYTSHEWYILSQLKKNMAEDSW